MRLMPALSPKLRMAGEPENFAEFEPANTIRSENFAAVGCLAAGGLSNVWGAVTYAYDRADMAGWPIAPADLAASYHRVSERIGISGPEIDELDREVPPLILQQPLPLSPLEQSIAEAYGRRRSGEFRMGRTRMAVLSADHRGRKACSLDNACMLGCVQGSIYASTQELDELAGAGNVTVERGFVVELLKRNDAGWTIRGRDRNSGEAREFKTEKVILAAGALASAKLGLQAAGAVGEKVRLENTPGIAFAVLFPRALGSIVPARAFGLTLLSFNLPLGSGDPADEVIGSLYPAGAMSATEFLARMPLTRPGGIGLLREMTPALMIALAFFPGRYSNNRLRLEQDADGTQLAIAGGQVADFPALAQATFRRLRRHFRRLGGLVLPGSLQIMQAGADVHYGGPLAMGRRSDTLGEVNGAPGLHTVDGAALPNLPARNPTLTIMANADRIGTALATAWRK
jgi:choline dehydrogenase-like flavoprotein